MAMPVPLAGDVDGCLMDLRIMIRDAQADGVIEHHEAQRIFTTFNTTLYPRVTLLTTTVAVIKSMVTAEDGCTGGRVQRMLKTIWRRPTNVIAFPAQAEGDPDAA